MTVRVGFLGGGFIASYHGRMLHTGAPDAEIVLVHDPDEDKGRAFAAASGATFVASENEVLDGSDAVYVCTWTAEHRRLVEAAAARGLPIFCEKPLATNAADARAMVDAVNRAGVVNQVGLVLRDSPSFLFLRHLVQQAESGRVMSVVFRDDQFIPIQGMYASTWRSDPAKAGAGTLLEHSIHDLDLLEWLFGTIDGVNARTSQFHEIEGIEDLAVATLQFADGGVGTLSSVWHDLLERPSMRRMEVLCERAFFVLEGDVWGPVRWTRSDGEGSVEGESLAAASADAGLEARNPDAAFIEAITSGGPAYPDFEVALRPHVLADAIYQSRVRGRHTGRHGPVSVYTLAGVIGSVGFESGDRVVVGHWWMSPLGAFTDVMWVSPDNVRVLYVPDERVARFITSLYRFERAEVVPFRTEGDAKRLSVEFGNRTIEMSSRFIAPIPFGRPLWFTRWIEGPVARALMGVRTYGVTTTGVREWYQGEVYRRVRSASATVDGTSLGDWGRPSPPLGVGFSEPPRRASVVNLRSRLLDPSGRLDELLGPHSHPAGEHWPITPDRSTPKT